MNNVACLITSRGNPEKLLSTCLTASTLSAKPINVRFYVRLDDDDEGSWWAIRKLNKHVSLDVSVGPRPKALGSCVNELAAEAISDGADYLCVLNDDVIMLTPNWDDKVRTLAQGTVSVWNPAEGDVCFDYPIVTRGFYNAQGGKLFTDFFPFWFDDRWLQDAIVIGAPNLVKQLHITLCARKRGTQRFRDIDFWLKHYLFMEPMRIAQAQRLSDTLGTGIDVRTDAGAVERARLLREEHMKDIADLAVRYSWAEDKREPDPAYLMAKAEAEERERAFDIAPRRVA